MTRRRYRAMPVVPYEYIGPCRCGFGHHAHYITPEGTVVHTSQIFAPFPALRQEITEEEELDMLKEDAKMIEEEQAQIKKRIEELEKEVK
jgi:uncharacterized protein YfcZ (UPF0381/DUF406 family)